MKYDREKRNLIGPVRSVHSTWIPLTVVDGKVVEENREETDFEIYDRKGRLIEETSSDRALLQDPYRYVIKYDDEGNISLREEYSYAGPLQMTTLFSQDESGLLTETTYNSDNEISLQRIFDKDGNVLEYRHYYGKEVISRYTSEYRRSGNKVEEISYVYDKSLKKDGEVRYRHVRTYNKEGKEVENISYRPDGSLWAKWTTTFDQTGHTLDEFHYDEDSSINQRTIRKFDKNGNIYEEACYEADGSLNYKREFQYEYDSTGNWIKQTITQWVTRWAELFYEPVSVTHRVVTYY